MNYVHNRENHQYDTGPLVNTRATTGSKALLTVGEIVAQYGPKASLGAVLAVGPYDPRVVLDLEDSNDHEDETFGFDDFETLTGILMDGQYTTYVTPEAFLEFPQIKVSNSPKGYRFFDEPRTRNASAILAELQDMAVPLEEPIQFERTRMNTGSLESGVLHVETEFNRNAEVVPCRNYRVRTFDGQRYYVHKDIVGYEIEVEDLGSY